MLKTFSITDVGRVRKTNQDNVYTSECPVGNLSNLFIVADGMGGHKGGDIASKTAIEAFVDYINESDEKDVSKLFCDAVKKANEVVIAKSLENENCEGMGTTLVACTIDKDLLTAVNIGDSRLYVAEKKTISQITRDHSLVGEMVRAGSIKAVDARNHPDKNIITRAVGASSEAEGEIFTVKLTKDMKVLMCSDGLSNMVCDEDILVTIKGARDLVNMAETLVKTANDNGGTDNISVIVIEPF